LQDDNDATPRSATLTATGLTGLSRGGIRWVATASAAGGVTFLDVWGSGAGSPYTV
jgi:hypothetical protein